MHFVTEVERSKLKVIRSRNITNTRYVNTLLLVTLLLSVTVQISRQI